MQRDLQSPILHLKMDNDFVLVSGKQYAYRITERQYGELKSVGHIRNVYEIKENFITILKAKNKFTSLLQMNAYKHNSFAAEPNESLNLQENFQKENLQTELLSMNILLRHDTVFGKESWSELQQPQYPQQQQYKKRTLRPPKGPPAKRLQMSEPTVGTIGTLDRSNSVITKNTVTQFTRLTDGTVHIQEITISKYQQFHSSFAGDTNRWCYKNEKRLSAYSKTERTFILQNTTSVQWPGVTVFPSGTGALMIWTDDHKSIKENIP